MTKLKYYYLEKEYGDKKAVRFEHGARPLITYKINCEDLAFPYYTLIWLMHDFLVNFYLKDTKGFENETQEFWEKADLSSFVRYEILVNRQNTEVGRKYARNLVSIYKKFASEGYNLAKPVPVTENSYGEIVALKGAKRIASLLAYGYKWIPVLEYNRKTLKKVKWKNRKTSCINHKQLIFNKMKNEAIIPSLIEKYNKYENENQKSKKTFVLNSLREIIKNFKREKKSRLLKRKQYKISKYLNQLDLLKEDVLNVVLFDEIEIIEWLYLRNIKANYFIYNEIMKNKINSINNIDIKASDIKTINSLKPTTEIWVSSKIDKNIFSELKNIKIF